MHAHDRCIDHLHRRVMTGGQRIHGPIPDASLPLTNEAVVASGAVAIGFRQIAPGGTCAQPDARERADLLDVSDGRATARVLTHYLVDAADRECPQFIGQRDDVLVRRPSR